MRGRLINKYLAEIHRLSPAHADPDFREPLLHAMPEGDVGHLVRSEHPPVCLPCQIDGEVTEEALRLFAAGDSPGITMSLLFHFVDLERLALVDETTGRPKLGPRDRLGALLDLGGHSIFRVPTPPGLYATEVRLLGFGLGGTAPRINLLRMVFTDRRQAAQRFA